MFDKFQRSSRWLLAALVALLVASNSQAQGFGRNRGGDYGDPPPRGRGYDLPPRQFAEPDRAADAARNATGGRVLGIQGADRDGQPGYRVRILERDGRVRNFHYDGNGGRPRD